MSLLPGLLCAWVLWGQLQSGYTIDSAYTDRAACEAARAQLTSPISKRRGPAGQIYLTTPGGYQRLICLPDTVKPQ
jgi:hypothetical protein